MSKLPPVTAFLSTTSSEQVLESAFVIFVELVPMVLLVALLNFCFVAWGLRTLFGMHRVGRTPVLFCSLHNSSCIRLLDLPSFDERGKLYSKKEVKTIELGSGGLLFTGDGAGELKLWRWAPQDEEPRTPVLA